MNVLRTARTRLATNLQSPPLKRLAGAHAAALMLVDVRATGTPDFQSMPLPRPATWAFPSRIRSAVPPLSWKAVTMSSAGPFGPFPVSSPHSYFPFTPTLFVVVKNLIRTSPDSSIVPMFHADLNLHGCKKHLNEEVVYYLVDSPWLDAAPWSYLQPVFDGISPVLTPECLNNVESLLCNTWFKQCSQVTDIETGENVYLPALMCQENCEEYRSVWDECVAAIEEDSEVLANFQAQRALLVDQMGTIINEDLRDFDPIPLGPGEWNSFEPLQCDVSGGKAQDISPENSVSAFFFGQYPAVLHPVYGHYSMYFPLHTSPGMLYPKENSEYTDVKSGTVYDVPCFAPGEVAEVDKVVCPDPFLSPTKASAVRNCVKPCPVQAYDDEEYTQMWLAFCIPGLVGLVVNLFMGATWTIATKNYFKSLPFNVKVCIFVGMYYCVVITLPSLAMKHDLACSCDTEECAGDGLLCVLSRSGIYALLAILLYFANSKHCTL